MRGLLLGWIVLSVALPAAGQHEADPGRERARAAGTMAVVVHPTSPVASLSRTELRAIFLRQRSTWPSPGAGTVMMLNWSPGHPIRERFDRTVLAMEPRDVAAYWIDRRVRGLGTPPRSSSSAILMLAIVARNPEAIAYLPLAEVTRRVKVLRIDGRGPDHPAYLLRAVRPR
jgi:ABC-type phosphate transport system substrate-binding protein